MVGRQLPEGVLLKDGRERKFERRREEVDREAAVLREDAGEHGGGRKVE